MKKRIVLVSLLFIMLCALALPLAAEPVSADSPAPAPAPAPIMSPAPAQDVALDVVPALDLDMWEAGIVTISVAENPGILSTNVAPVYGIVAGLNLVTIVASAAYLRRKLFEPKSRRNADTDSPDADGTLKCPLAGW